MILSNIFNCTVCMGAWTVPHPYKAKFNGVSLEDIADDNSDLENTAKKILRFITGAPRGDTFWERFIQNALFTPQILANAELKRPEPRENMDYSKKIFSAYKHMSDMFFGPVVTGEPDEEFDAIISDVLTNQSKSRVIYLSNTLHEATLIGLSNLVILSQLEAQDYFSMFAIDLKAVEEFVEKTGVVRFTSELIIKSEFLNVHQEEVLENLRGRFASNKNWPLFERCLSDLMKVDIASMHNDLFLEHVTANAGERFMERINGTSSQLNQLTTQIWKDIDEASYLPHSDAVHSVEFSHDSLPEIIGLGSISFTSSFKGGHEFVVVPKEHDVIFSGRLDESGEITFLSPLREGYKGFEALLKNIIVMSYHDLTIRNKNKVNGGNEPKADRETDVGRHVKKSRPRSLPRSQVVYNAEFQSQSEDALVASAELVEVVNQEGIIKGFKPRLVDTFIRKLPGAYDYLRAVAPILFTREGFHSQGEPREEIMRKIAEARAAMHKPSEDKLRTLPKRFQLNYHDWPDGRVYVENWVVEHPSPKLSPEEERSLVIHYQKRYRGGSSLAFLDYIKSWIFE